MVARLKVMWPQDQPIEGLFKWFYGNCLAWISSKEDDLLPGPNGITSWEKAILYFPSNVRRFVRNLIRTHRRFGKDGVTGSKNTRALSIGQTLLMMKKGTPPVDERLVKAAEPKHKNAMSSKAGRAYKKVYKELPPAEEWGDAQVEYDDVHKPILQAEKDVRFAIKMVINEVFPRGGYAKRAQRDKAKSSAFPSFSAHFESSRKNAGAVSVVGRLLQECIQKGTTLLKMIYHPRLGVREVRGSVESVGTFTEKLFDLCEGEKNTEPVYLREPLKVRTITKGPALPYWVLKDLQQYLWGELKKHPNFQLIGRPISAEVLGQVLGIEKNPEGVEFTSGDYSAATDNLRACFSEYAFEKVCRRLGVPGRLEELGQDCLTHHQIHYADGTVIEQENGQLMGSPLSFPILCLINMAVCLCGYGDVQKVRLAPILVNGDDCVMRFNRDQHARWEFYAKLIGMEPSPGKCYRSRDWLQMNSELFKLTDGAFKRIPFLNFSLASPYLAKGGEDRHWTSFGTCARSFVEGFPKRQSELLSIYIKRMKKTIVARCPKGISWGLPEHLGGLGLPYMESDLGSTSGPARNLANYMYQKIVDGKASSISQAQDLPGWVRRAMVRVSEFTVSEPSFQKVEAGINLCVKNRTELMDVEQSAPGLFSFYLWEELQNADLTPRRVPRSKVGTDPANQKWYKLNKEANRAGTDGVRSLHELLLLQGVVKTVDASVVEKILEGFIPVKRQDVRPREVLL